MAVFKLSTLFNLATATSNPAFPSKRVAGWSESVYANAINSAAVIAEASRQSAAGTAVNVIPGLWIARAALLPLGSAISGYRIQQVDVPGPVQTASIAYPGIATRAADIPQMALLCSLRGLGVNNIRRFTIRAIPDVQIVEGEFQPQADYLSALSIYFLSLGFWSFRAKNYSTGKFRIISVAANGTVTTELTHPFVANQMVQVRKVRDSGGNLRSFRGQISGTGVTATQFSLPSWPWGATTGGSVTGDAVITYPQFDVSTPGYRAVTRRVGRPFIAYRGRRSKKR